MPHTLEQMTSELLCLPTKQRAQLAHALISSLEGDEDSEEEVGKEWNREIARRAAEIESGSAKGRPAEQVLQEIRAEYR